MHEPLPLDNWPCGMLQLHVNTASRLYRRFPCRAMESQMLKLVLPTASNNSRFYKHPFLAIWSKYWLYVYVPVYLEFKMLYLISLLYLFLNCSECNSRIWLKCNANWSFCSDLAILTEGHWDWLKDVLLVNALYCSGVWLHATCQNIVWSHWAF